MKSMIDRQNVMSKDKMIKIDQNIGNIRICISKSEKMYDKSKGLLIGCGIGNSLCYYVVWKNSNIICLGQVSNGSEMALALTDALISFHEKHSKNFEICSINNILKFVAKKYYEWYVSEQHKNILTN